MKIRKELKRSLAAVLAVVMVMTGLYVVAPNVQAADVAEILQVKMQTKTNADGTIDMRVISSVDSLNYKNVGFDVYYAGAKEPITFETATVLERISATSDVTYAFSPKVISTESKYFVTGTIKGIKSTNTDETFYIRPFLTTLGGAKEYGQSRYFTVDDATATTNINIPVEMKAVSEGSTVSVALSKNGTDTFETASATVAKYENGFAHLNIPITSVTDKKLLTSATLLTVAGGKADGSDAKAVYRNLETTYTGSATADTSWYDVYAKLGESKFTIATNADLYGLATITNTGDATKTKQNFLGNEIYLVADIVVNDEIFITESTDDNYKKWYSYNASTETETYSSTPKYKDWASIGTGVSFAGTFDGQMHTISGLCQPSPTARRTGLFSQTTANSNVCNLKLTNSYFNTTYNSVGSIVGYAQGTFNTIYSDALVESSNIYAGGLFGMAGGSTIDNCWFDGKVENTNTGVTQSGGIIGIAYIANITMTNCLNTGTVDVSKSTQEFPKAGGFVGDSYNSNTNIVTSLNSGVIKTLNTSKHAGSVVGWISSGTVKSIESYAYGAEYVIGKINSGKFYVTYTLDGSTVENVDRTTSEEAYQSVPAIDKHNTESNFLGSAASTSLEALDFQNTWLMLPNHAPILNLFKSSIMDDSWYDETVDTYVLCDAHDLYGLAVLSQKNTFEGKTIKLANDIQINSGNIAKWATRAPNHEWMPIGTADSPFAGTFDGAGHTISGLYVDTPLANVGLFGVTADTSVVTNLILADSYIASTATNLGSIAGQGNGLFDTVKSNATVSGSKAAVGGIIGQGNSAKVVMQYCWFDGNVTNSGNTTADRGTGGMIGVLETGATATIQNCLHTGSINATAYTKVQGTSNVFPFVAGFVGYVKGSNSILSVTNCLNTGDVLVNEAATGCYGLFVGYEARVSTSTNNYTITPETWTEDNEIKENYNPKKHTVVTDEQIAGDTAKSTLKNFDFVNTWSAVTGNNPILNFTNTYDAQDIRWYNASASEYTLYDKGDLYGFASLSTSLSTGQDFANKTVKLGRDIIVNEGNAKTWEKQAPSITWTPVNTFSGIFDGAGHTISGLYLNATAQHSGLFATTNASSVVKNLYLKNSYFTSTGENLGSIAGRAQGTLDCVYSDAIVVTTGGIRTGGLVGMGYSSAFTLNKCWFAGTVKNTTSDMNKRGTGGLVGVLLDGGNTKITDCLNAGTVDVTAYKYDKNDPAEEDYTPNVSPVAGGIVGWHGKNAQVDIRSCVSVGKILVSTEANEGYSPILGYSYGKTLISDCYATTESCQEQDKANIPSGCTIWVAEADIKGSQAQTTMDVLDWGNSWKSNENDLPSVRFTVTAAVSANELQQQIASHSTMSADTASATMELSNPSGVLVPLPQGGCVGGDYFYQAFITYKDSEDENNNKVKILKYDLTNQEVIQESGELSLNHANDITYNSRLNSLIVCHNAGAHKKLTFIDPDSLQSTGEKILDFNIYSIDYEESTNRYIVGLSGGEKFYVLNSEFEKIYEFASKEDLRPNFDTNDNMTQGIACDDKYIYCVISQDNAIVVYDWFGNYKSLISLDVIDKTLETENISVVDNIIYVAAWNKTGAMPLYKLDISNFVTAE